MSGKKKSEITFSKLVLVAFKVEVELQNNIKCYDAIF